MNINVGLELTPPPESTSDRALAIARAFRNHIAKKYSSGSVTLTLDTGEVVLVNLGPKPSSGRD